jgi:hypothetical protein
VPPPWSSRSASCDLESIVDDVRKFSPHEQHDDITMIVAKCEGN